MYFDHRSVFKGEVRHPHSAELFELISQANARAAARCPGLIPSSGRERGGREGMPPLAFAREVLKFRVQGQALLHVTGAVEVRA
jgi:hypothetical protein